MRPHQEVRTTGAQATRVLCLAILLMIPAVLSTAQENSGFRVLLESEAEGFEVPADMVLVSSDSREAGETFSKYQQYLGGVVVRGARIGVVRDGSGVILKVIGTHYSELSPRNEVVLTSDAALEIAAEVFGGDEGEFPVELEFDPQSQRFVYRVEKPRLGTHPICLVDAESGEVVAMGDLVLWGEGRGVLGDTKSWQDLSTYDSGQSRFEMRSSQPVDLFQTFDAGGVEDDDPSLPGTIGWDDDDRWYSPSHPPVVDAQYYARLAHDYYLGLGFDWQQGYPGEPVRCSVNMLPPICPVNNQPMAGAKWDSGLLMIGFTQGDGTHLRDVSGSLEVAGHEMAHAVERALLDLDELQTESAAFQEAFADIMGTCLEFSIDSDPSINVPGSADWTIGEDIGINGYIKRSMEDPKSVLDSCFAVRSPSHYRDICRDTQEYASDPHFNSGILNHWFYLWVEGGVNADPNRTGIGVGGIGETNLQEACGRLLGVIRDVSTTSPTFCDLRRTLIPDEQDRDAINDQAALAWDEIGVSQEVCGGPDVAIERPAEMQIVSGPGARLEGWATDLGGVREHSFFIRPQGGSTFLPLALNSGVTRVERPDICQTPDLEHDPDCPNVGWRAFFNTEGYQDGVYTVKVVASDFQGASSDTIRTIRIDNSDVETVEIQPDQDSWIDEAQPGANGCPELYLYVAANPESDRYASYLQFTADSPPGRVISAQFRAVLPSGQLPQRLDVFRIAGSPWSECAISWSNPPQGTEVLSGQGYFGGVAGRRSVDLLDFWDDAGEYTIEISDPASVRSAYPAYVFSSDAPEAYRPSLALTYRNPRVVVSDAFETGVGVAPLHGRVTEVGNQTWSVAPEESLLVDMDLGRVYNQSPTVSGGASFDFHPQDYAGLVSVIEAELYPNDSDWVGFGFSHKNGSPLWTYGLFWVLIRRNGVFNVFTEGTGNLLATGTVPHPDPNVPWTVRLHYDPVEGTGAVEVDGENVYGWSALNLGTSPDRVTAQIRNLLEPPFTSGTLEQVSVAVN